jgi:mono/diheme cytochrome c family protein
VGARVQIFPAGIGQNHFAVELPGTDPAVVERVQLTLTYLDGELGSQPLVLSPAGDGGTWAADAALLSQPGRWQAQLLVRRQNQDDARSAVRFTVAGPGSAADVASSPQADYPLLPSPQTSAGFVAIAVGAVLTALSLTRGERRGRRRVALVAAGLCVLASGGYVYAQDLRFGVPWDVSNVRNPLPPDETNLTSGRQIYQARCAVCHGVEGRGDGPAGVSLNPRPADLRVHMAAGHTDGQLFYWVSYGFPNTAMPAWHGELTEDQRWQTIDYIRTFADSP